MKLSRAFEIVLELARDNALSKAEARENDLCHEYDNQQEALKMMEWYYAEEVAE